MLTPLYKINPGAYFKLPAVPDAVAECCVTLFSITVMSYPSPQIHLLLNYVINTDIPNTFDISEDITYFTEVRLVTQLFISLVLS